MTTSGEIVWEWRSWEHMEPEAYPLTLQDHRAEWTHGNTVAETAEGNIVVSFRNISTVIMIERATGNIIWQLGSPPLAQQHDPRPLANGNILIFDNGTHRRDHPATFSRVIEVDPRTSEIVWQYSDQSLFDFFSPYISGAQRLANGNTLICEGCYGRIFEVTARARSSGNMSARIFAMNPGAPASTTGCSAPSAIRRTRSPPRGAPRDTSFRSYYRKSDADSKFMFMASGIFSSAFSRNWVKILSAILEELPMGFRNDLQKFLASIAAHNIRFS